MNPGMESGMAFNSALKQMNNMMTSSNSRVMPDFGRRADMDGFNRGGRDMDIGMRRTAMDCRDSGGTKWVEQDQLNQELNLGDERRRGGGGRAVEVDKSELKQILAVSETKQKFQAALAVSREF